MKFKKITKSINFMANNRYDQSPASDVLVSESATEFINSSEVDDYFKSFKKKTYQPAFYGSLDRVSLSSTDV